MDKIIDTTRALEEIDRLRADIIAGRCAGVVIAWHDGEHGNFLVEGGGAAVAVLIANVNAKIDSALRDLSVRPAPGQLVN